MTTALLVIDAQQSFRARDEWADVADPAVADRIAEMVDAARARREPVFWVLHTEPGTGTPFDPAFGHVRLMAGLVPRGGEPIIMKTSINAFTSTDLESQLRERGIHRVAICGIRTEQCCETTARVAADLVSRWSSFPRRRRRLGCPALMRLIMQHRGGPPGS